jgi:hypothetical protein
MNQFKIEWVEHVVEGRKSWRGRATNRYFVQVAAPIAMPGLAIRPVLRVLARSPWWYGRAVLSVDVPADLEQAQHHAITLAETLQELVERIHGLDVEALKQRFTSRESVSLS